jgi:transcriptional regulator of acetoin/glycerol metabolism
VLATLHDRRGEGRPPHSEPVVAPNKVVGLPQIERDAVTRAYEAHGRNLTRAAASLQIPRSTLRDRLRRYGIR